MHHLEGSREPTVPGRDGEPRIHTGEARKILRRQQDLLEVAILASGRKGRNRKIVRGRAGSIRSLYEEEKEAGKPRGSVLRCTSLSGGRFLLGSLCLPVWQWVGRRGLC